MTVVATTITVLATTEEIIIVLVRTDVEETMLVKTDVEGTMLVVVVQMRIATVLI